MNVRPFDPLDYMSRRDAPRFFGWSLIAFVKGRPRYAARLFRLALCALALTGCATTRYVPTYCLTKQQYDQLKAQEPGKVHDQLTGQADRDTQILGGSAIRLRAWGEGELQVLGGCVQPANTGAAH